MMHRSIVAGLLGVLAPACFDPAGSDDEGASGSTGSTSGASASATGATSSASTTATTTSAGSTDVTSATGTTVTTDATSTGAQDSSSGGATTGIGPSCGDGVVDEGEVCDDGTNAGAAAGDCAPDCSKLVEEKIIRLSADSVLGDFALGEPSYVAAADTYCPRGYQALIADGTDRVGSLAPLMGNGQVDWPIQSWTAYVNAAGDSIWTTTELRLLGVADDNTWAGLTSPIDAANSPAFTVLADDYTTHDLDCLDFTVGTGMSGDMRAAFGQSGATDQAAIGNPAGSGGGCGFQRFFYCVEQ